jgi:phenylacetate-CoA ligase
MNISANEWSRRPALDVDYLPADALLRHQSSILSKFLHHTYKHPLTRKRMSGITTSMLHDEHPIEILRQISPAFSSDHSDAIVTRGEFADKWQQEGGSPIVFSTGGTTGQPTLLVNTYDETLRNAIYHGKGYHAAGIRSHHRVATLGGTGTFASEYCVYHALNTTGCTIVPINDFRRAEENVSILEDLFVSALLVMPSEAFPLLDFLESRDRYLPQIKLVVTGGEPLSHQLKTRMSRRFSSDLAFGSTFQTADVGTVGYQCHLCGAGEYHVHSGLIFAEIEVIDGNSELIITNLDRKMMPVLRLRTGDRAEWVHQPGNVCECGRTSPRIRLLGRTNEIMKMGGEKVSSSFMAALPASLGINEDRMLIEISRTEGGVDAIAIYCNELLEKQLQDRAVIELNREPKLAQMLVEGRCALIGFFPEKTQGDLRGSGKRRVVIDVRS